MRGVERVTIPVISKLKTKQCPLLRLAVRDEACVFGSAPANQQKQYEP